MHDICERFTSTHKRIIDAAEQVDRNPRSVALLAVSKKHSIGDIKQAIDMGQVAFGENYLQEALEKMAALAQYPLEWHYIGQIQSNKARDIAQHFHWVQSVDRLKIAQKLSQLRPTEKPPLNILLQVNINQEPQKAGINPADIEALAKEVTKLPHLCLRGLMAIPMNIQSPTQRKATYKELCGYFTALQHQYSQVDTLSMGMSQDLEAAIAEGATMVRIGTDLFGPRS